MYNTRKLHNLNLKLNLMTLIIIYLGHMYYYYYLFKLKWPHVNRKKMHIAARQEHYWYHAMTLTYAQPSLFQRGITKNGVWKVHKMYVTSAVIVSLLQMKHSHAVWTCWKWEIECADNQSLVIQFNGGGFWSQPLPQPASELSISIPCLTQMPKAAWCIITSWYVRASCYVRA